MAKLYQNYRNDYGSSIATFKTIEFSLATFKRRFSYKFKTEFTYYQCSRVLLTSQIKIKLKITKTDSMCFLVDFRCK